MDTGRLMLWSVLTVAGVAVMVADAATLRGRRVTARRLGARALALALLMVALGVSLGTGPL